MTVALEPFTEAHFATLAGWFASEDEVRQWGGPAVHHPLTSEQMRRMLSDSGPAPAQLAWSAAQAGAIVGHVQVWLPRGAEHARLGRIAIAPDRRGRGLAAAMLEPVIDRVFALDGIVRIDLGVYVWNQAAITTYERLGFQTIEIRAGEPVADGARSWDSRQMSLDRGDGRGETHPGP